MKTRLIRVWMTSSPWERNKFQFFCLYASCYLIFGSMAVVEWCRKFRQRREFTTDLARPGLAHVAASDKMCASWKLLYTQINISKRDLSHFEYQSGNCSFHNSYSWLLQICYIVHFTID